MKILFLSSISDVLIEKIQEGLTPEQCEVFEFYEDLDITPAEADLIFMDYSLHEYKDLFFDVLKHKHKLAILIAENDYDNINSIFYSTGIHHLFSISDNLAQLNFITDMQEFLLNWGEEVTLESLMPEPAFESSAQVVSSCQVDQVIEDLISAHDFSQSFDDLPNFISNIFNEVLTNALFNAPINEKGQYLHRSQDRSEHVAMIPGKEVEAKLLSSPEKIIISVKDFYGSLMENNLFDYPPDTGEERKAGMRLGMYLIFRYGHKYIINVKRNEYTEIIVIIENSKRFKNYELREKSFHFFLQDAESHEA